MPLDLPIHGREVLEQCWLLQPLALPTRERLLGRLPRRSYADGQLIFSQGDPGTNLLLVLQGRVRIGTTSREGRELTLGIVEAGDLFGEMALLDGKQRSADAVAFGDCVVASLDRRDLLPVLRDSPEMAIRLLELVCGRVRSANDRLEGFVFHTVEARLARLLLAFDGKSQRRAQGRPWRDLSQSDLARLIGASRQTVNQLLSRWAADGIVGRSGRVLVVKNRQGLATLAEAADPMN